MRLQLLIACLCSVLALPSWASPSRGVAAGSSLQVAALGEVDKGGIAWFGTWQDGLAEARRTGRPILLVSGAPQCHGVSGYW